MKKYITLAVLISSILSDNSYASYQDDRDKTRITELISSDETVHNDINQLRLKPNYKALAMTINDKGYYAYWYTFNMESQKQANTVALFNCNKASRELVLHKSCKLYNDIINKTTW